MKRSLSQLELKSCETLAKLTDTQFRVLEFFLSWMTTPGYRVRGVTTAHETIAKELVVTRVTVTRCVEKLRQLGLVKTEERPYTYNITWITDWFGLPFVQSILPLFFKRFPLFYVLTLVSLMSGNIIDSENKIHNLLIRNGSVIKNCLNRSLRLTVDQKKELRLVMKAKIEKILGIRAALVKRGETELIDPYKLTAFSDECLDDCIVKMKFATPKYPYRYFLKQAFEWSKWNNIEPDFVTADALRESRIPEFEQAPSQDKLPVRPAGSGFKKAPEEPRKSNEQIVQETKERQKREQQGSQDRFKAIPRSDLDIEDQKTLQELREQLKRHTPGSFQYGITADLIRGFEGKFAKMEEPKVEEPVVVTAASDFNNPAIRAVIQAQVDRLREVDYHGEDGIRIRAFLNEIGIKV